MFPRLTDEIPKTFFAIMLVICGIGVLAALGFIFAGIGIAIWAVAGETWFWVSFPLFCLAVAFVRYLIDGD